MRARKLRTALALTFCASATAFGFAALNPATANALAFDCHYVPNPPYDCKFGTLNGNQASGWSEPRNFWGHRAWSNINTQYRKGLAWYRNNTMYGWWYGGNNSTLFERYTSGNPPQYTFETKAICKNADYYDRPQIMMCQTIRD